MLSFHFYIGPTLAQKILGVAVRNAVENAQSIHIGYNYIFVITKLLFNIFI